MQSKWLRFAGAGILAAGLTFAYAEAPTESPAQHKSLTREQRAQQRFDRMASYLNLTDAQRTQAQGFWREAHESAKALAPQLKQNRQAMSAAVKANNTADIERLAAQRGTLMGKMTAIRTEAFAKVYQTLTPDQRVKADQMHEHMRNRVRAHTQSEQ